MFEKLTRLLSVFFMLSIAINAYSQSADYGRPAGFLRMEVQPNDEKLASTPFDPFGKSLNSQIFGLTGGMSEDSGDQIRLWDAVRQSYISAFLADETGDREKDGQWLDADLKPSNILLVPGLGFFIRNNHGLPQNAYLAGKLPLDSSKTLTLYPSFNLFSYPYASKLLALCAQCNIYAHNDYSNECKNIYYRPI